MSRNKARIVAMQALFQMDTNPEMMRTVVEARAREEVLTEHDLQYLEHLNESVVRNKREIDAAIQNLSIDWDIGRLGKVERAILRLAMGEILYVDDVPVSVAINEAVRLGKKYGAEPAGKFINGILGKFARERLPEGHPKRE